jgi:o-succinylbenzoate---CoA ligase
MFLPDPLARRAAAAPCDPALIVAEQTWTWSALHAWADTIAFRLRDLGLQAGDRVALLAGNTPAFVAIVHALPRLGAVLVPLNIRLTPAELAWQIEDSGARLVIADDDGRRTNPQIAQMMQIWDEARASKDDGSASVIRLSALVEPQPSALSPQFSVPPIPLDSPHTIIYTSGTTGRPKGAVLTFGNHWWSAVGSALNLGLHADDRWLAVLPLFHVGGLSILLRSVFYGIPVVLHERFDPAAVNASISEQRVTIISVVTVMLQHMLAAQSEAPFPSWLRCVLLGGGPAPQPLLEQCAARGVPVVQTYGMTETASQAVTLSPADALRKLGSAGRPLLPVEVRIVTENGGGAATDVVGEICLRGPNVTIGYHNRPDATAEALRDGWLHTGDLGYLDAEGYLYVVDRRTDLIISGGENIYPAEVEAALLAHPAVAEAGVVGAPDAQWGRVPVAFVVLRPDATPPGADELIACVRERLAAYKAPRRIIVMNELPRTASGKLRRNVLREGLENREPRTEN